MFIFNQNVIILIYIMTFFDWFWFIWCHSGSWLISVYSVVQYNNINTNHYVERPSKSYVYIIYLHNKFLKPFSSEQELNNLLQQKKYTKAIGLAIRLEQPFRALKMFKGQIQNIFRYQFYFFINQCYFIILQHFCLDLLLEASALEKITQIVEKLNDYQVGRLDFIFLRFSKAFPMSYH